MIGVGARFVMSWRRERVCSAPVQTVTSFRAGTRGRGAFSARSQPHVWGDHHLVVEQRRAHAVPAAVLGFELRRPLDGDLIAPRLRVPARTLLRLQLLFARARTPRGRTRW
jgi:hypothetical protein